MAGEESTGSQVSVRTRRSIDWSEINSERLVGLSRSVEVAVAERILRRAKVVLAESEGPGLRFMSPERRIRREKIEKVEGSG